MPLPKNVLTAINFDATLGELTDSADNRDGIAEEQAIHPQAKTPQSFVTTGGEYKH